jgi:hypothetical protein
LFPICGLTVIVTEFEVAGFPLIQLAFEVTIQLIMSPFARVEFVYVELLPPSLTPLIFHWKLGELPPLTGVAVKVTSSPEQIGFEDAEILILTGRLGLTVIVMVFDVAGLPLIQLALEVITQLTVLPFARALVVYVELLVPTLLPLSFHW